MTERNIIRDIYSSLHRCDECHNLINWQDFERGLALRQLVEVSDKTKRVYHTLCRHCFRRLSGNTER